MKTLDTSEDKIQKICDVLRKETLEPAQKEAESIIEQAKKRAEEIVRDAHTESEELLKQTQVHIAQQQNVFQSSLEQAAKQGIESLKQSIEDKLFNAEIAHLVTEATTNPQLIAELISSLVNAIDKEGLAVDLSVFIPANLSVKEINQLLTQNILNKLKNGTVNLGDFGGGVKIRLENKKITLDITHSEIADILKRYVRKDFRKYLFA